MNNKFILAILTFFILAMSASCVSAEDISTTDIAIDDVANANVEEVTVAEVDETAIAAVNTENAVAADEITGQNTYTVDSSMNNSEIQNVINNANAGDTIKFAAGEYHDIDLSVDKTLHFIGAGSGENGVYNPSEDTILYGIPEAETFNVAAGTTTSIAGTSFQNIAFVFNDPDKPWNGRAIQIRGGENILIENCAFDGGNAGLYLQRSVANITVINNYFTGTTNKSSLNPEGNDEQGTKAINAMGGNGVTIANNTFAGELLDGTSIASGASNILVENNKYINNTYGIFFGGGLVGIEIYDNYFENCNKQSINLMKSSSNTRIENNKFVANSGDVIYLQQGNTAHGAPTTIGSLYIDNNEFTAVAGTDPEAITAVYVESQGGPLKVSDILSINNNTLQGGIDIFDFYDLSWGEGGNITILPEEPEEPEVTDSIIVGQDINITSSIGDRFEILLKDSNNKILANQSVIFTIDGIDYHKTTDENGYAYLNINLRGGQFKITVTYAGSETTNSASAEYTINVEKNRAQIIAGDKLITKQGTPYTVQVLDLEGKPIPHAVVAFHINGITYYKEANENGEASLTINLRPGIYNMYISYDGDSVHDWCTAGGEVTVRWE